MRSAISRPAAQARSSSFDGCRLGLLICEDVWEPAAGAVPRALGAEVLLIINASPYEIHKQREREQVLARSDPRGAAAGGVRESARRPGRAGVRRQLVRDGRAGQRRDARGRHSRTGCTASSSSAAAARWCRCRRTIAPELSDEESVYRALVLGVRDYVSKHGFPGRRHGPVRRRGFGADAGDRGRCARAGARACGHDAIALYLADEPARMRPRRRERWA